MILDGEQDDIIYDDYDDSNVAASEAEIDEKYPESKEPEDFDAEIEHNHDEL